MGRNMLVTRNGMKKLGIDVDGMESAGFGVPRVIFTRSTFKDIVEKNVLMHMRRSDNVLILGPGMGGKRLLSQIAPTPESLLDLQAAELLGKAADLLLSERGPGSKHYLFISKVNAPGAYYNPTENEIGEWKEAGLATLSKADKILSDALQICPPESTHMEAILKLKAAVENGKNIDEAFIESIPKKNAVRNN